MTMIVIPVLILTVLASILLMIFSITRRTSEKSLYLIPLSVASFLYTFGYILEVSAKSTEAVYYGVRVQYMGWPLIMPMIYFFIRDIYAQKRLSKVRLFFITLIPIVIMTSVQLFPLVKLYYIKIEYVFNGYIGICRISPGPLYYVWVLYGYIICLLIFRLIIQQMKISNQRQKRQGLILIAAISIPILASLIYLLLYQMVLFDPTPIATSISLSLMLYIVGYDDILDVLPLARTQVIEDMQDALIICDSNFNFLDANRAAKYFFPDLKTFTRGMNLEQIPNFETEGELWLNIEGTERYFNITQTHILDASKHSGICIVFHDITEKEQLLKKLQKHATFDPLLHIYNRATFFDKAIETLKSENAYATDYAVLMMDIDHFKQVNDIYGHLCGDAVLETLALLIKSHFHKEDLVGRYGGEEIIVLLRALTPEQAFRIADNLRNTIEKTPCYYQQEILHITISIGVAFSPRGEVHELNQIIADADAALYRAKNSGRNQVRL